MRVRDAANIGRVLVIVHLVMSVCLSMIGFMRMIPMISHSSRNIGYLATSFMSMIATIVLDVGLLIVLSSLARTEEQFLRDEPAED
jgi:hypothetical protein